VFPSDTIKHGLWTVCTVVNNYCDQSSLSIGNTRKPAAM